MALCGLRVVEMAGLAPAPFCGMIMADFGASVIRVDKPNTPDVDRLGRGKRSIVLDVKKQEGRSIVEKLCSNADVLIEPYRAGVMEKMGLGPKELMKDNPKLIYARLTGFGQSGPYADMAGHDINYLALSGQGQVIDANMVEGAAYTGAWMYSSRDLWVWGKGRGCNWLDSGAHFYETYETSDGRYMAVGAIEPQFYDQLISLLGLSTDKVGQFDDFDAMKIIIKNRFKEKTQEEWTKIFDGKDACVTPVLSLDEAPVHPHNAKRGSFIPSSLPGNFEPGPAPRLSRTPGIVVLGTKPPRVGQHTVEVLVELGYSKQDIDQLLLHEVAKVTREKAHL
ncbi:alpha-methylacyl-CoA racemase isoform X2 [Procambarus clarkii]|uniref:alpha-methylacyl-CoA racemase isoform X2 n=1 Tax=Procambarus clarkii TaxID=6728 RepID=UPI001E6762D3|nr:alpha-methylacyl-CoA racemase-like isoform X2 [Procambarus clarkii]